MRQLLFCCLLLWVMTGCTKKDTDYCYNNDTHCGTAVVIRDCTGTYLRYKGKDYKVCNAARLKTYQDQEQIKAGFHAITKCNSDDGSTDCKMYHAHEGLVEVTQIR